MASLFLLVFDGAAGVALAQTEVIQQKGIVRKIDSIIKEVTDFSEYTTSGDIEGTYKQEIIKVEILSEAEGGAEVGEIVAIENDMYENPYNIEVEEGDKVFLYAQLEDGVVGRYSIQDYWHLDGIIIWSAVFLILVLIIGGRAGVKAILSLAGSVALVFFVLLPLIKQGYNPVLLTVGISAVIILFTHVVIAGFSKKSWLAMGGTLGGVVAAAVLVYVIGYMAQITGLGTEDARILTLNNEALSIQGILFAGIILGALGAVMDVSISIASGLAEIKEHQPKVTSKQLVKSGFNIGKDILASMLNTLIFAYIGAAMISIILFYSLQTDLVELLNYGFIAEEIVRSLVGSLGLLCTIPLTAGLSGAIMGRK